MLELHIPSFHPRLTSPIPAQARWDIREKGGGVLWKLRRAQQSSAPFEGLPEAIRSAGGESLLGKRAQVWDVEFGS